MAAVARLERLRHVVDGERQARVLVRLALAYDRLRDTERRDEVLQQLTNLAGEVILSGEKVSLSDADGLRRLIGTVTENSDVDSVDWPVSGGGPARTNRRDAVAGLKADWSTVSLTDPFRPLGGPPTSTDDRLAKWAAGTGLAELAAGHPGVPSAQPVSAQDAIFFRTPAGVTAIDPATGGHRWRTLADELCWDYFPEPAVETPNGETAARTFVGQRLWSDATWGTLATDGRIVFAVVETGAAAPLPPAPGKDADEAAAQAVLPAAFNRLAAFDAKTGGRVWEAGGPPGEKSPLAGAFFLGPPIPAGGRWYALAELAGVTHLVALDPARPEGVLWTQPIAEHDAPIDNDSGRRTAGLSPCLAGGLLVCPAGPAVVVAVDPSARSLAWAYAAKPSGDGAQQQPAAEGDGSLISPAPRLTSPDVIAAGNVLIIGSQAGRLAAVDPLDGSLRWETEPPGYLWLIGTDDERAFAQTPTGIVALRLANGVPAWDAPAAVGPPSGRGVIVRNRLFVPLLENSISVIDSTTGRAIRSIPSPHDEPFGNLIVLAATLVSQSATRIVATPLPE